MWKKMYFCRKYIITLVYEEKINDGFASRQLRGV